MHFRSLARSESGGEFKTPTGARLAFGERTFGQISTSGGDSMVLTASNKRVSDSVLAETVNGSGNSDDMSVVGEHSRIYDYGELPPELDILLADDGKDKGASHTSQFEHSNPIQHDKRDAGSCLNPSGVELLSSSNREIDAQLGLNVEKASDGAISAIQVILDKGNDGIPVKLSKDRTNSPNVRSFFRFFVLSCIALLTTNIWEFHSLNTLVHELIAKVPHTCSFHFFSVSKF